MAVKRWRSFQHSQMLDLKHQLLIDPTRFVKSLKGFYRHTTTSQSASWEMDILLILE